MPLNRTKAKICHRAATRPPCRSVECGFSLPVGVPPAQVELIFAHGEVPFAFARYPYSGKVGVASAKYTATQFERAEFSCNFYKKKSRRSHFQAEPARLQAVFTVRSAPTLYAAIIHNTV